MTSFQLIDRDEVPNARGGHWTQFTDALEAALANPEAAVKLEKLTQRQRNRLVQVTSPTTTNKGPYAGKVKATAVRNADATYDVYLTKAEPETKPAEQTGPLALV